MTPAAAAPPPWRAVALVAWLAVATCAGVLFLPLLGGYFISDDFVPLVLLRQWQDEGALGSHLLAKFTSSLDAGANHFYRPLSYLTFGLNYLAGGVEPMGWMAVNIVLHLASGVLVAFIGVKLSRVKGGAAWAAGAGGAAMFLFAAPGGEVVAWISGRFDSMATFFTLAACAAFVSSRRRLDVAWWIALACGEAALLSKESAAVMPFAILLLAAATPPADETPDLAGRARSAIVRASPWLALAALYLLSRYFMFGSATQVYGGSDPLATALAPSRWGDVLGQLPTWLEAEFGSRRRFAWIVALTLVQVVLALAVRRGSGYAALAVAAIVASTLVLLLPHVASLPIGLGGRLFYQTFAFFGVLVAIGLSQARLRYLMWGATLGAAIFHVAAMHVTLARWQGAYGQMRGLVQQLRAFDEALGPGEFALVIVPGPYDGIPFARNAQGGLMLPPLFGRDDSHRSLVQTNEEIPEVGAKIASGVVRTLRERSVVDFLEGRAIITITPEYPTRATCWNTLARTLEPLDVGPQSSTEEYRRKLARAFAASACAADTGARSRSSASRRSPRAGGAGRT
ncbi:MAG TPA: hypothetical protein VH301_14085 [Usitatibacter sp.]|nr:hypothetical protein [Usitatibacter sp.]